MISKQQIKYIRSLHQKKYRNEYASFIAEGIKIVNEAIAIHPDLLEYIIYTADSKPQINNKLLKDRTVQLQVTKEEYKKITSQTSPQKALIVMKKPEAQLQDISHPEDVSIALDKIRDPGNFGTIIRLADWFGIKQIVCSPDTVDCYNSKVIQASMGAIFRVNIYYVDMESFLKRIKVAHSVKVYSTSLEGSDLYQLKLTKPAIIILGNESGGVSEKLKSLSDEDLRIPDYNKNKSKSESLNVSLAAAIICSEFRRHTN